MENDGAAPADREGDGDAPCSGHRRLPRRPAPLVYDLRLDVDPEQPTFAGEVTIALALDDGRAHLDLHAERLEITGTTVIQAGVSRAATTESSPNGGLRVHLPPGTTAGEVQLVLTFEGPLDEVPEGLYRVREGGVAYVYTQFEPLSARRCFPCFDEPGFKAPFRVRLRVPAGCTALANARCTHTATLPDGRTEAVFAQTPPLATYLVAVAVGPFDVIEGAPQRDLPPLRVVTTRGRGHLAAYALDVTPRILAWLTRWFDLPYPYDKLDLVGVPNFAAGAMENVGLVTFRERLLLLDAGAAPATDRLWAQVVIAHELAHMWFGNLVTMRWWDDLWLNEAFATWMEMACVAAVDPPLDADLEAVGEGLRVMDHDALSEARAIRQPIVDGGDVLNAFDGITYSKGAAVVRMTESWLGAQAFRDGVRQYLVRHAHGNADTADLLGALAQVSGQPVASTLVTFLDQPGLPLVEASFLPGAGAGEPGVGPGLSIRVTQRRWLPAGATTPPGPEARWHLPVSVRVGDAAGAFARVSTLLTAREGVLSVPPGAVPAGRTPTWLHPNAEEGGYYRWTLAPEAFAALLRDGWPHLTPAERLGLPEHIWALYEGARLPLSTALEALAAVASDPHRMVLTGVCAALRRFGRLVPETHRPVFATWVEGLLGPHLDRLGVLLRPDDDPPARLMRPVLLTALADAGAAPDRIAEVVASVDALLADFAHADPEVLQYALPIAAFTGDDALRARLAQAVAHAPTPAHRAAALVALGSFSEPGVAALAWSSFFTDLLRAQDFFALMRGATRCDETQHALWRFLDARFEAIAEKIGDEAAAHLPVLSAGIQDAAGRALVEACFALPARRKPGADRNLRQALEDVDRRVRLCTRSAGPFATWLEARPRTRA
jgi:alanyl aminopeptidase